MKLARIPKSHCSSGMDDEEVGDLKSTRSAVSKPMKAEGKLPFVSTNVRQAMVASKAERVLVVGISIYDPTNAGGSKYRQVRAPMGGGIRYPSVRKNTTKQEQIELIHPLFQWRSQRGAMTPSNPGKCG